MSNISIKDAAGAPRAVATSLDGGVHTQHARVPSIEVPPAWFDITPNDNEDLPSPIRALRADEAGNVAVIYEDDTEHVMRFAAGETRMARIKRVKDDGTTAGGLEGAR